MNKSVSASRTRNRHLIAKFAARTIAKNNRGIKEHGGGLQFKNTLPEIMGETFDLVNYLVEHEEQVKRLVEAAENYWSVTGCVSAEFDEALRIALAPFLNKPETRK